MCHQSFQNFDLHIYYKSLSFSVCLTVVLFVTNEIFLLSVILVGKLREMGSISTDLVSAIRRRKNAEQKLVISLGSEKRTEWILPIECLYFQSCLSL